MNRTDFEEICERWLRRSDYEIERETDPFYIMFMMDLVDKGKANEKDLAKLKGYFSGLAVAKGLFEKTLWYYAGEHGIEKECEDWYNSMATKDFCGDKEDENG